MATPSRCAPFMVERAFPIENTVHIWPHHSLILTNGSRDWHSHWDRRGRCWFKSRRGSMLVDVSIFLDAGRDWPRAVSFGPPS